MKVVSSRYFAVALFIFFSTFAIRAVANLENGETSEESPSSTGSSDDILKNFFSSILGLNDYPPNSSNATRKGNMAARMHTPQYVQNLYDRLAFEIEDDRETTGRRRRSINGGSYNFDAGGSRTKLTNESATIQAVARKLELRGDRIPGSGYLLEFNIDQLWIPNQQVQSAELVLALDHTRLVGPPGAYTVYAYVISSDDQGSFGSRARLLVSTGSLGIMDTFGDNFVMLNVTDVATRKILANDLRPVKFEIFVAFNNPETGSVNDLDQREVEHLFHLNSHGSHQPLLVLYSASANQIGADAGPITKTRRRRGASRPAAVKATRPNPDAECNLHEWWIELTAMFVNTVIIPQGFYANYCGGTCHNTMYHHRWNATNNALLRGAYNSKWLQDQAKNGSNLPCDVPEPKCVAQSYSPITIVYNVGANYVIRRLDDIVVNSCMCA